MLTDGRECRDVVTREPCSAFAGGHAPALRFDLPAQLLGGAFVAAVAGTQAALTGLVDNVAMGGQVVTQLVGIAVIGLWSGILTWVLLKLVDAVSGLRVAVIIMKMLRAPHTIDQISVSAR